VLTIIVEMPPSALIPPAGAVVRKPHPRDGMPLTKTYVMMVNRNRMVMAPEAQTNAMAARCVFFGEVILPGIAQTSSPLQCDQRYAVEK
jgi:hypothetical protein